MKTFLFLYFYQNNIVADLADAVPGNDVFVFTSEKTAEFTGPRDNQGIDPAGSTVKFKIDGTSEAFAGAGINDFLIYEYFLQIYMTFC